MTKNGFFDETPIILKVNFLFGVRSDSLRSPRVALVSAICKSLNSLQKKSNKKKIFRPLNPTKYKSKRKKNERKIYIENEFRLLFLPTFFPFVDTKVM